MTTTAQLYELFLKYPIISTDTRKIAGGSLFFALKGDNFDANKFAKQAIETGAAYAVINNPAYQAGENYLLVDDVLTALQDLARHHRRQLTIPVIGLTGTNGKTTTKELIYSVLSQHFTTHATQGNLNNHIGVPLTILAINSSHQVAVIEMGANHQKEIELLCSICLPTHGLITNVGKAHLEGFGGVEGVKKGKGELYDYLSHTASGVAFVNCTDQVLMKMQQERSLKNIVFYGDGNNKSIAQGKLLHNAPLLTIEWANGLTQQTHQVQTQLTGAYNLDNILAAISIGIYLKLNDEEINRGIENYQPKNNRSQIVQTASNTLICDYYNANPSSMFVAIENMAKIKADHKVLILGDMFEMGEDSAAEHQAVINKALQAEVNELILIGKEFSSQRSKVQGQVSEAALTYYPTVEEAIAVLKANPIHGATVLIKGSRGMALERLVELF